MSDLIALIQNYGNGCEIQSVRHLTDKEKTNYVEWARETTFICTDDMEPIKLRHIKWEDLLSRGGSDGSVNGGNNQLWLISPSEIDYYIALNAKNTKVERVKELEQRKQELMQMLAEIDRFGLHTPEEVRRLTAQWIATYNEGGEGYVPHYYTFEEAEYVKSQLAAIEAEISKEE